MYLYEDLIHRAPTRIADSEHFRIETFRFRTGVAAASIANSRGRIVVLPFDGQQIWDARFDGRRLTMASMIDEPRPNVGYLETYGAFLLHCGGSASDDRLESRPLHGELPHARYQAAWVETGSDDNGPWVRVGGAYTHTVAFGDSYSARPSVRMRADSALLEIDMEVENHRNVPMELKYMAHLNFVPVDHGELIYSAPCDPQNVVVQQAIPRHTTPPPGYREFLLKLARHPEVHNVFTPGLLYDPQVVLFLNYVADGDGWARTMQMHPDGTADVVRHKPAALAEGVRWISRTPDQDCLGMILPATAGYSVESATESVPELAPGATWIASYQSGVLTPPEAELESSLIAAMRC